MRIYRNHPAWRKFNHKVITPQWLKSGDLYSIIVKNSLKEFGATAIIGVYELVHIDFADEQLYTLFLLKWS